MAVSLPSQADNNTIMGLALKVKGLGFKVKC